MLEALEDEVIAAAFEGVWWVRAVPLQEGAEVAHLGPVELFRNEGQIGGLAIGAIVADCHVEERSRNVADHCRWRLEGVGIHRPARRKLWWRGGVE